MFEINKWPPETPYKDPKQLEMEFLWPHNAIQLDLDLDYPPPKLTVYSDNRIMMGGTGYDHTWETSPGIVSITSDHLNVSIPNSIGSIQIGGISIAVKEQPKWYQRILYKLLGFNWKDK